MISPNEHYRFNGSNIKTAAGSCSSYNVIYLVVCTLCNKHYIGRSTRPLKTRIGEHRRNYYRIVDTNTYHTDNDEYALGAHLYNHGFRDKDDFAKYYLVSILEVCSPKVLEVKEHKYIHILNSLSPMGINISNSFSMPILHRH